jgi:hypothetical protein
VFPPSIHASRLADRLIHTTILEACLKSRVMVVYAITKPAGRELVFKMIFLNWKHGLGNAICVNKIPLTLLGVIVCICLTGYCVQDSE